MEGNAREGCCCEVFCLIPLYLHSDESVGSDLISLGFGFGMATAEGLLCALGITRPEVNAGNENKP